MTDQKMPKFVCAMCAFKCSKKSNYAQHCLTLKHCNALNAYVRFTNTYAKNADKVADNTCIPITALNTSVALDNSSMLTDMAVNHGAQYSQNKKVKTEFKCLTCSKIYKHKQSLFKHRKTCHPHPTPSVLLAVQENTLPINDTVTKSELIEIVKCIIQDIHECKNEMLTAISSNNITNNNNNNNTLNIQNNNNNNTFNLQFYLNETCKHAMNISEFMDSIKVQLSDLESFGKIGYVESISNIITTKLKALEITKRPIQCADKKREVVYIKDDNKWEKEDDTYIKLRKLVKRVSYHNDNLLAKFKEIHPGCNFAESAYADQYSKIVMELFGGATKANEDKIIKIIGNVTIIDKAKSAKCIYP